MTVGELIEKLTRFDRGLQVGVVDYVSGWRTIENVTQQENFRGKGQGGSRRIGQTVELN